MTILSEDFNPDAMSETDLREAAYVLRDAAEYVNLVWMAREARRLGNIPEALRLEEQMSQTYRRIPRADRW